MMEDITSSPGFYGKLPVLGDFVSRRIPRDFISSWDSWLQSAISASKEELGDRWLEYYLTSPIWRFLLSPGVCGQHAWAGIVMPSVDRVGRYFPLTVAIAVNDLSSFSLYSPAIDAWFAELEASALAALEKDLPAEKLDNLLKDIDCSCWRHKTVISVNDNERTAPGVGKKAFFLQGQNADISLVEQLQGLSNCLINDCFVGFSLWQSKGSETVKPAMLMCEGLPPLHAFSGLLTGSLSGRGWDLQQKLLVPDVDKKPDSKEDATDEDRLLNSQNTPITGSLVWRSSSAINCGKRRQLNEDALLERPEKGLWVIADGMGGHQAGDVASNMIVDMLDKLGPCENLEKAVIRVKAGLLQVNAQLRQLSTDRYGDQIVGSTVVALIAGQDRFACVWAGDSRLYRLRHGQLQQLTVDHSEDSPLLETSDYSSIQSVKTNNVITRAVGAFDRLELDLLYVDCEHGDKLLLCSDGVDKELSPYEIERVLNQNHSDAADALMQEIMTREARDNISIIVVEVSRNDSC